MNTPDVLEPHTVIDMTELQERVRTWRAKNFDNPNEVDYVLGVCEEAGELARALLKSRQGIREFDDPRKKAEYAKDAMGDSMIFMMGVCDENGWNLGDVLKETIELVTKRDWKKNPIDGS